MWNFLIFLILEDVVNIFFINILSHPPMTHLPFIRMLFLFVLYFYDYYAHLWIVRHVRTTPIHASLIQTDAVKTVHKISY